MQALQDLVRGVRNSRADYGVELGRKIAATLHVQDVNLRLAQFLRRNRVAIMLQICASFLRKEAKKNHPKT